MSGMHRIEDGKKRVYVFRIKLYTGMEFHIVGPTVYEVLELFRKHPSFDPRVTSVTQIAEVDMS